MMWHLRVQAALFVAGTTGLGFIQTVAGGLDPRGDPIVNLALASLGWPLLIIGYGGASALLAFDLWKRWSQPSRTSDREPGWITVKQAVDYIRGQAAWKPKDNPGEMWGVDLDRDLRRALATTFGPRARGREYSLFVSGDRTAVSAIRSIPRSFWRDARFDPMQIASTPARLVARNEAEKRQFDDIEVERVKLERAFPRASPTVHIPAMPDLKQCFKTDFPKYLKRDGTVSVTDGPVRFDILAQIHEDYTAHSKFVSFYVPHVPDYKHNAARAACEYLATNLNHLVDGMHDPEGMKVQSQSAGDATWTSQEQLKFSGAVFIYYEGSLTLMEMADIEKRFLAVSANVKLRGASYASTKSLQERAK
jgi:hypothetical protein